MAVGMSPLFLAICVGLEHQVFAADILCLNDAMVSRPKAPHMQGILVETGLTRQNVSPPLRVMLALSLVSKEAIAELTRPDSFSTQ